MVKENLIRRYHKWRHSLFVLRTMVQVVLGRDNPSCMYNDEIPVFDVDMTSVAFHGRGVSKHVKIAMQVTWLGRVAFFTTNIDYSGNGPLSIGDLIILNHEYGHLQPVGDVDVVMKEIVADIYSYDVTKKYLVNELGLTDDFASDEILLSGLDLFRSMITEIGDSNSTLVTFINLRVSALCVWNNQNTKGKLCDERVAC